MDSQQSAGMVRVTIPSAHARRYGRSGPVRFRVGPELRRLLEEVVSEGPYDTLSAACADLLTRGAHRGLSPQHKSVSARVRWTLYTLLQTKGEHT